MDQALQAGLGRHRYWPNPLHVTDMSGLGCENVVIIIIIIMQQDS